MKKSIILLCLVAIALSACNTGKRSSNAQTNEMEAADPAHNSRNSLDWQGVYRGVLPCADCEGIQEEIRLNDDMTYELVRNYLGKGDNRYSDKGRFEWDDAGARIKLISADSSDNTNRWFKVGENQLIVLDTEGNPIESGLPAELYVFQKMDRDNVITEKYWKLVTLNGKEITTTPEGTGREAHFILKDENQRVFGNTGCNNMNGTYILSTEDNTLSFKPMATTRMACIGVDNEQEYLDVFQACDRYNIENDTLTLSKGDAPLAKFAAVYLR